MPPLCLHLGVAREAALVLRNPIVDANLGGYAIGSTVPDVQVITSLTREETHFFDLSEEECESGTKRIFEAHPHLGDTEKMDDAAKALVAGYLSHLITDELWILEVYRPLFSAASPLGDNVMANMLDKLVQYELDRREREDRAAMEAVRSSVLDWEPVDVLGFIEANLLAPWRDFVGSVAVREPDLGFFPAYARRYLLHRMNVDEEQLGDFFSTLDTTLEWTIQYVTPQRLTAFREKAVSLSVTLAREYLDETD